MVVPGLLPNDFKMQLPSFEAFEEGIGAKYQSCSWATDPIKTPALGEIEVMKSYREELTFETKTRRAYINITRQVEAALKKSGIKEGLCLINPMHISASVYINDD